ncbi:glutathione S-transferase [Podospora didyma]|uniref:Glutathione S-transferase n=1 Tax=Podospora didyma TaxID=330526 RepID=A0AAE0U8U8_9PEZI|nr:glutathione S-transferase [Podospora didyma]
MSSSSLKPVKLWGKDSTNPKKVAIILEELGVPVEFIDVPFSDVKKPEYVAINPNGRLPSIHDPNTDLTLWESGAILEYLIEKYDTGNKLSFAPGTKEYYLAKQWLFFQTTGQGPYYGQAVVFKLLHPEQLPSALERYLTEIKRVTGVLEAHLKAQKEKYPSGDGPWLVGNKLSYADLSFVTWQNTIETIFTDSGEYNADEFPVVKEWLGRLYARASVKKVLGK